MQVKILTERKVAGKRLGRSVEHDPRSKAHEAARHLRPLQSVSWTRHCPAFDQGDTGSCTGHALVGALMTEPFFRLNWNMNEADAVSFYHRATLIDRIPGSYPPEDTGSSGLAVAKVAKMGGFISAYKHAFGIYHMLEALQSGPVIVGINWYDSFDVPNKSHTISISPNAGSRGGHEVEILGVDVVNHRVRMVNSWGTSWGDEGYCWIPFNDVHRLLLESGDVTVLLK